MLGSQFSHSLEVNLSACGRHIQQEVFGESTILDIAQDLLHRFLGVLCDDLRSGNVISIFRCIGDGVSHSGKTGLINQIDDQFHLMDTLKVCVSRVVSGFHQRLITSLHQSAHAAAENRLLTEQVCFCLCTESSLQHACSCAADG